MTVPATFILALTAPAPSEYLYRGTLTRDNFGLHYVRYPYDPAVDGAGNFVSSNPSRWQSEIGDSVGWLRTFDPNLFGRYVGGSFVQVGMTTEGSPVPYGRIEGGTWYKGMLKSDGTYDFSKLDLVIETCKTRNLKLLMSIGAQGAYYDFTNNRHIEYPLPTGEYATTNWVAYQQRFAAFISALLDHGGNYIGAIEVANEPGKLVRLDTTVGPGHTEQLVVMTRIVKQLVTLKGLTTKVLSTPFQGGEVGEISKFLLASAAGIAIDGVDGSGTKGKDWIDVLAHHNYGNYSDRGGGGSTTAMDNAGWDDPAADAAYPINTLNTDMLSKARAVATAAIAAGFIGERWNTEFNCTGSVASSATTWSPRKLTSSGFNRIFSQCVVSNFIGGYSKCFFYAADHPALGFYDNVGTPPAGEAADAYNKAPDNTARGATQLKAVIDSLTGGELVAGLTSSNPFTSVGAAALKISNTASGGVFT